MIIKAFNFTDAITALKSLQDKSKIQLSIGSERILFDGVWVIDIVAMLIIKTPEYKTFMAVDRHRDYDNAVNPDQLRFMYESNMASRIYIGLADECGRLDVEVSYGAAMRNEHIKPVPIENLENPTWYAEAEKAWAREPYFCVNTKRWM
jgi:hypothetical protein